MKKSMFSRVLSLVLVMVLCLGIFAPVSAVTNWDAEDPRYVMEKVDNSEVSAPLGNQVELEGMYKDEDIVRVTIVLEKKSTLEMAVKKGISTHELSTNTQALKYRNELRNEQETMVQKISNQVLGGEKLDVNWNLTLAANVISANVEFGKLDAIRALPGVASVNLETQFELQTPVDQSVVTPNMLTSSAITGSNVAWESGYTGAGMRIAIIDSGVDLEHEAFNPDALEYALEEAAAAAGKEVADFDLLDVEEIASVLDQLNAYGLVQGLTAEDLYYNTKVGFGLNYVDLNTNITHVQDLNGTHGSHVAGIAAANRYVDTDGDGVFEKAADVTKVVGNAPDAQLIILKGFGARGGPFETELVAMIEDAILLGADVINMSLGSNYPGYATSTIYEDILDLLDDTDTVLVASSGNNSYWGMGLMVHGYLSGRYDGFGQTFAQDVNFATGGTPGTYGNTFTVASAENTAYLQEVFEIDGAKYVFYESEFGNLPMASLDTSEDLTGTTYEYVFIDGIGTAEDYAGIDVEGKIVFCKRGEINFYDKANIAVELGAIGIAIYNTDEQYINMDLTDYKYTAPVISVLASQAEEILSTSIEEDGYYTGEIIIYGAPVLKQVYSEPIMSYYSSWGVPGDLSLKPEITAPGGNIYSVSGANYNGVTIVGADHNDYQLMSGTSMAAPQVTGMTALVLQYIKENNLSVPGMTDRALAQSLLMSTAIPMKDSTGNYNAVFQQGAGLGNTGAAIGANSYITVVGTPDGKVKAELGDDPERTGVYEFSFVINNMSGNAMKYDLSADLFTQATVLGYIDAYYTVEDYYVKTETEPMNADVVFAGEAVAENVVTVPANGKAEVKVTMTLTDEQKAYLDERFENGAYVEAYVFAKPQGETGVTHSIPVLAFYGCWGDSRMLDYGSIVEPYSPGDPFPYMQGAGYNCFYYQRKDGTASYLGGNPVVTDPEYMPERNALSKTDKIVSGIITPIRNMGALRCIVTKADEIVMETFGVNLYATYYYPGEGYFEQNQMLNITWRGNEYEEGDQFDITLQMALEYYVREDGTVDWDSLGKGATMSTSFTIDDTAPELHDFTLDLENNKLTVIASDNNYVAGVALYNSGGTSVEVSVGSKAEIEKGAQADYELDLSNVNGKRFLLQVIDYAGNRTTYIIKEQIGNEVPVPEIMVFNAEKNFWQAITMDDCDYLHNKPALAKTNTEVYAAAIVNHVVLMADKIGNLWAMDEDDLSYERLVTSYDFLIHDMAYHAESNTLYAVDDTNQLITIDPYSGATEVVAKIGFATNSLAVDKDGVFYSNELESGRVWAYTLEDLKHSASSYDFDGDGVLDGKDVQALLDYAVGNRKGLYNMNFADMNEDDAVTSADADLLLKKMNNGELLDDVYRLVAELEFPLTDWGNVRYVLGRQTMEIDPKSGMLYWATNTMVNSGTDYHYMYEIDVNTGAYEVCGHHFQLVTALLFSTDEEPTNWAAPTDDVTAVSMPETATVFWHGTKQLKAQVLPWMVTDATVTWKSADESIATVDQNGNVFGVNPGTTTITATSNLDPTVFATCEITVDTLNITLHGALENNNDPMLFTWDMTQATWTAGAALDFRIVSGTANAKGEVYLVEDNDPDVWPVHRVDPATGETLGVYEQPAGIAWHDLDYSEFFSTEEKDMANGVYFYYYTPPTNLQKLETVSYDFSSMGMITGASEFLSVTSAGTTMAEDQYGNLHEAEVVIALDDNGYIWQIYNWATETSYSCYYRPIETNLRKLGYETHYEEYLTMGVFYLEHVHTNMFMADDGYIYLSAFDGNTSVLYRMIYDEVADFYNVERINDFGLDVYPAIIYDITFNGEAVQPASVGKHEEKMMFMEAKTITYEEMKAAAAQAKAAPTAETDNLVVDITAKDEAGVNVDSTNAMFTVTYDPTQLKLVDVADNAEYFAYNDGNGKVILAYANSDVIPAGEVAATLTFERLGSGDGNVTVTCDEVGVIKGYEVQFQSASASLDGLIGLNFYVTMPEEMLNEADAKMVFTLAGVRTEVPVSKAVKSVKNGETRYRFTLRLTATQMADEVTARMFVGETPVSRTVFYSVQQYAAFRIENSTNAEEVALVKAMLNYGAAAQLHFDYNVNTLANAILQEADKVLPEVDAAELDAYAPIITGEAEGIVAKSGTLLLQSGTVVRVYFELTGEKTIDQFTFTVDGKKVTPSEKDGRYYLEVRNIAAAELDKLHTFTCDGITVTYGPMSYVRSKLSAENATLVALVESLHNYHETAKAYFGK